MTRFRLIRSALNLQSTLIPTTVVNTIPRCIADAEGRKKAFGGVMQTFDNTRPPAAAMALGVGRAALDLARKVAAEEGVSLGFGRKPCNVSAVEAKAGRMGDRVTLRCVELCQSLGYSESLLLEKFARDSKIVDIFEGTQQIQQLIVALQVLGKSSSELK